MSPTWSMTTICSALTMVLSLCATIRLVRSLLARSIALWICLKIQAPVKHCNAWFSVSNRAKQQSLGVRVKDDATLPFFCVKLILPLCCTVQRRSGFVEDHQTGLPVRTNNWTTIFIFTTSQVKTLPDESPGYGNSLSLSTWQLHPSFSHHRLVLQEEDGLVCIPTTTRTPQSLIQTQH